MSLLLYGLFGSPENDFNQTINPMSNARRLNARYDKIWATYKKQEAAKWDLLPTCMEYAYFLDEAVKRLKITIDEARSKYGQYTYGQWKTLMGLA